jgi:hypothetical protein
VFENRVWRGMSGEKEKGKGKNCIIRRFKYSSPNIAREITLRIMGHFGQKTSEKLVERPRQKLNNNIKTDLREIRCEGTDWFQIILDRAQQWISVNKVMNLWVPQQQ